MSLAPELFAVAVAEVVGEKVVEVTTKEETEVVVESQRYDI
jgi:hypothetical protein